MLEKLDIRTRAIIVFLLTIVVGFPVMLSYALVLFSLFTNAASVSKYTAISVLSVLFVLVLAHIYVIIRALRPLADFLNRPKDGDGDKAVRATITAPLVISGFSLITWPVGTFSALVFFSVLFPLPMSESIQVVVAGGCVGILVTLIQYYLTRLILGPERRKITEIYPDYWKNPANRPRFGVRYSILASSMLLILASLLFAGIMNYSQASLALIRQVGKERARELKLFTQSLGSNQSQEGLSEAVSNQFPKGFADGVYVMDRNGRLQVQRGGKPDPDIVQAVLRNRGAHPEGPVSSTALLISTPDSANQNWFIGANREGIFIIASQDFSSGESTVFSIDSWERHKNLIGDIKKSTTILTIFALLIAALIVSFSAYDLSRPINEIRKLLSGISKGDLSRDLDMISESEIGDMAINLKQMVNGLRDMIGQVEASAGAVEEKIAGMRNSSRGVMDGIETQQQETEKTFASMDGINSSIGGIGENLELLVSSVQDISSSVYQMDALIGEVAENIESLSHSASESTAAISQIASSVGEIRGRGENLSLKSREALDSMEAMEGSIRKIEENARQTSKLSDQVQEDAETGFKSVLATLEGIGKIREAIRETAKVVEVLGGRIEEISTVLTVIDEVTEETGLLSLNASIIAAQAGEHGRGFAVVADEIKALAERTTESTREISGLIQSIQTESRSAVQRVNEGQERIEVGVKLARESGEALSLIVNSSQKTRSMIEDIVRTTTDQAQRTQSFFSFIAVINQMLSETNRALKEQGEGALRITEASARMQEISDQINKAAKEEASGSKQITRAIENLNEISKYISQAQKGLAGSSQKILGAVGNIKKVISENTQELVRIKDGMEEIFARSSELRMLVDRFKTKK
ncbi:MAG: methyl-accepting chemotaxis protein [bacterium]|nr:methyl-accepting chemotaxis protein [bacterium]